jgi:cysteine desulfurase
MPQPPVYLDNGATTRVDPRVADAVVTMMTESYGNPSSAHHMGVEAQRRVQEARERLARVISADPGEITFTSGGTEANALGFYGAARARREKHVVHSAFEHPSVIDAGRRLVEQGYEVTTIAPEPNGVVDPAKLAEAVRIETGAVTLLWVQNEIGTVQPVAEVARLVKARAPRCHVHVDAVQALGKLAVDVNAGPFDSMAFSAHKIHGPKGAGALWLRKGARVQARQFGGGQEKGLRPGTEGVPGIVGLGLAVELAEQSRVEAAARMAQLRDRLWTELSAKVPGLRRHGDPAAAAPHILSVGFPKAPAEPLLHAVEARGVCVSAGSACHAKDKKPSATLKALSVPEDMGTLRFSFSRFTTDEEISLAVTAVCGALASLQ